MIKKLILVCLMSATMLMPAASCGGGIQYEAIEIVPEGAEIVAGMKVSEALRNWQLYAELQGSENATRQFDEIKEQFLDETGIDMNDISEAVIFGKEQSLEAPEYAGFIMTGNFADRDVIDRIEKNTGHTFTEELYCKITVYIDDDSNFAAVRISNTMMIIGSIQAVKDCIDVIEENIGPLSGTVLDTYNDLGDVMIKLAMHIPQETKETFAEQPGGEMMPVGFEAFEDMQSLGLAADLGTQALTVNVNIEFSPAESAPKAAESIDTMIGFFEMMSQDEEMAELLDRIKITTGGSRVYLNYEISLAELAEIAGSMADGTGIPFIPSLPSDGELPEDFEFPGWGEFPDEAP